MSRGFGAVFSIILMYLQMCMIFRVHVWSALAGHRGFLPRFIPVRDDDVSSRRSQRERMRCEIRLLYSAAGDSPAGAAFIFGLYFYVQGCFRFSFELRY